MALAPPCHFISAPPPSPPWSRRAAPRRHRDARRGAFRWSAAGLTGLVLGRGSRCRRRAGEFFEELEDLGMLVWSPGDLPQKRLFASVTADEVRRGLRDGQRKAVPQLRALDSIKLPKDLSEPDDQKVLNVFPHDPGFVVPLLVAHQRRGTLDDIDFLLGGSALNMLAEQTPIVENAQYLTQKCPVTGVIVLARHRQYTCNYAYIGFQFERLMTGHGPFEEQDLTKTRSLRIIRVGHFRVLVCADVDAVDAEGKPVEMKTGNPHFFGMQVILQMLSNGSQSLISGGVDRRRFPPRLMEINRIPLEELVQRHWEDLQKAQDKILEGLSTLKSHRKVTAEFPSTVDFLSRKMLLVPQSGGAAARSDLFPDKSVVEELFRT